MRPLKNVCLVPIANNMYLSKIDDPFPHIARALLASNGVHEDWPLTSFLTSSTVNLLPFFHVFGVVEATRKHFH